MLDPAPRVVLDPELGMLTVGVQPKDARIANDIYRHTIDVITTCQDRLGGWHPLPDRDLFDVEYWELEQAKLRLGGAPPPLAGRIAVVTGAASGIGRACAAALLGRGAAVVGIDRAESVTTAFGGASWLGAQADVTDADAVAAAIERGVEQFGGVDIAVLGAGIFGASAAIASLDPSVWSTVLAVNLDAVATSMRLLHPFLARSPVGGRVVLVGSKNVAAPGPGRRVLRVEGRGDAARARRRARVGGRRDPRQHGASRRGVRHRAVVRGAARRAGGALRPERRAVQAPQPARHGGDLRTRRRTRRRSLR